MKKQKEVNYEVEKIKHDIVEAAKRKDVEAVRALKAKLEIVKGKIENEA